MKRLIQIFVLLSFAQSVVAQKIAVGYDIPTLKSMKENIVWINGTPPEKETFQIIDFFSPENKSCVGNLDRLSVIADAYRDKMNIIVLTKESGTDIHELGKLYKGHFFIGIDTTGNGYFEKCYVKYLPYSIFTDYKSKLIWHGFLHNLSDEMVEKIISNAGQ